MTPPTSDLPPATDVLATDVSVTEAAVPGTELPEADYRHGLIEVYGFQEAINGWIAAGWIARALTAPLQAGARLLFSDGGSFGPARVILYSRADLGELDAVGFIVAAERPAGSDAAFAGIGLATPAGPRLLGKANEAQQLPGLALAEFVHHTCLTHKMIAGGDAERQWMSTSWGGQGFVEVHGYHMASEGLFAGGWVSNDWLAEAGDGVVMTAQFESSTLSGPVSISWFERDDIRGLGLGFVAHLPGPAPAGKLRGLQARAGHLELSLSGADQALQCEDDTLIASFGGLVDACIPSPARRHLRALLDRPAYAGSHTLATLPEPVLFHCDALINSAPDSMVMLGWLLAKPDAVKQLLLCSSPSNIPGNIPGKIPVDFEHRALRFAREDVIAAVGQPGGFTDPRCGFMVRIPLPQGTPRPAGRFYLEVHTVSGGIGFAPLPEPGLEGIAAIRKILADIKGAYDPLDLWFDEILGPPITALRARERRAKPRTGELGFGALPGPARHAVVVPLAGRLDAMEIQIARYATLGIDDHAELIYVLDDPDLAARGKFLAHSVYERFRLPLRLITLDRAVGFGRAANIGLAAASAPYVCLLNEAIFATDAHWLTRLARHLETDAALGAVAPLLLFEDGSVQHQGFNFKPDAQYGHWYFPTAPRKAFRPDANQRLHRPYAISGAGVMLRRNEAIAIGGFDEAYLTADFIGTDLSQKLRTQGKHTAIDFGARLYHLERNTSEDSSNLSLYDAWVHQRRWAAMLAKGGF